MKLFLQKVIVCAMTAIAATFFYAWGALTGYPIQQMTIHSQGGTMFSGGTIADLLAFIFGTGAVLSGLIERYFPGWDKVPAWAKKLLVGAIGVVSPVVLIALQLYIPPDVLKQTGGQLLAGVAVALAAMAAHQIDLILQALAANIKARLATKA